MLATLRDGYATVVKGILIPFVLMWEMALIFSQNVWTRVSGRVPSTLHDVHFHQ
jgi:hypothetical protein